MSPVKSIRVRYILGLGALAVLIAAICFIARDTIERQENNGRVINIAGNQIGLSNRISFFVGQMRASATEEDYVTARVQVGRAVHLMRERHAALLNGDPARDIPKIMTPLLDTIYFDPGFGLDGATKRFLEHAEEVYRTEYGELEAKNGSYVYVVTYGPYVLETLLNAAVTEYEEFNRREIQGLRNFEIIAMAAAMLMLLVEALFIFRPLERKVRDAIAEISTQRDALGREKNRAEHASRAKTDFLSNMSHELRTPLNAIIGFTECLTMGIYGQLATPKQRECVETINRSGNHLLNLVNDILDVGAAEAGTLVLDEGSVSVDALISSSVTMIAPLAKKAGVVLHMDRDRFPAPELRADERRVRQILINLLTNAVKYTGRGGNVRVRTRIEADGRIGFEIADTGVGMTAAEIAVARERFGRAGNILTRGQDGAGLGLPMVIDLAARHGASVDIVSQKGRGTRVTVLFPAERRVDGGTARRATG